MYRIIFCDLDGTLLNDEKNILEENKEAIKKVKDTGVEVILCSGRQNNFVKECKTEIEVGDYIISCNGAEIYDCKNNEELFSCEVDKNLCNYLYNYATKNNFFIKMDTKYGRYINNMKYSSFKEIEFNEDIESFLNDNKILQLSIAAQKEEEIDKLIAFLKDKPYVKVENKYCEKHDNINLWMINIINSSVSKGNAISGLCKYLKINLEDAIAFGDDINDISMFETVGLGVAMGNSLPEVKESAKVVIGDNNNASIADYINQMIG